MRRTIMAQQTERFVETDEIDRIWQRLQRQPMRRRENAARPPKVQPLS
jgi:hypothetical protein